MSKYTRIPGGEKNAKSGLRWTKEELRRVFSTYKKLDGLGIHEHNPAIHHLAKVLGRTVRSVEAQLLMFRNLEKRGNYSFGNMSRLCKEIWLEHLNQKWERGEQD